MCACLYFHFIICLNCCIRLRNKVYISRCTALVMGCNKTQLHDHHGCFCSMWCMASKPSTISSAQSEAANCRNKFGCSSTLSSTLYLSFATVFAHARLLSVLSTDRVALRTLVTLAVILHLFLLTDLTFLQCLPLFIVLLIRYTF